MKSQSRVYRRDVYRHLQVTHFILMVYTLQDLLICAVQKRLDGKVHEYASLGENISTISLCL